jgi:hypothetical protein
MKTSRRLTHRARDVLPLSVVRAAKGFVGRWGTLTARWRMLPEVVIVGAQRSGTTTLFRLLSDHPQVVRPTASKGMAYFDLNYDRGPRWYRGQFPLKLTASWRSRGRRRVTFESSGYYMFHPLAAERIAAELPDAKVIVMLRNPVDRAYSAHRHELRRGFETEEFEAAVELEPSRIAGEADRIRADPLYRSFEHQHHAYLGRGEYAAQIIRLHEALGRERTYVVDADEFFRDQAAEFAKLVSWLGLEEPPPRPDEAWNAQPREPLSDELRERLMAHFAPYDEELSRVLGWTPSWRSGQPLEELGDQSL